MTRADKSRFLYAVALLVLGGVILGIWWYFSFRPSALIIPCIVVGLPGRITALLWKDFYAGGRAMRQHDYDDAKAEYLAFLDTVRGRPWLKHLIYTKWGIYTWDIEAMTLNNLGVAFLETGYPEQAARWLEAALDVDANCGVAYANLAIVEYARGNDAAAARLLGNARALGNRRLTQATAREKGAQLHLMVKSRDEQRSKPTAAPN